MLNKFSSVMQIDQNNSLDSLDSLDSWILINKFKSHFGDYARKLVLCENETSYIDTSGVVEAHNSTDEWF